ncbi:MAG: flagellar hook-length control protein FliK, partial [Gallionella sp.]|nr:flagellar hook-length control protein FliK [Gallionella sp.]
ELNDKAILSVNKSAIGTPALSANSAEAPTRATNMRTGPARENSDATITSAKTNADISAQPGLRSEPLKATELSNSAMQAPQMPAQAGTAPALQPNATPGANSTTLTTPLGHSAWPAEFSQKVSWISTQKNQVAELHLNPPDLGPINIVLKISDNQATALFTSPHSAVRDAIENAMPKLRESLAENGITLGQTTVSDQTPRDNSSASFMNQRAHTRTKADDTAPAESVLASLPLMTARQHKGMVDTFA